MFQLDITITKKAWLSNPKERWNAGLEKAGLNFRQSLSRAHYPPVPPNSTYVRTGTLANKANFRITEPGQTMEFGSTYYLPFLLAPARTVQNWAGKKDEVLKALQDGFKAGVRDYKGE